MDVLVGFEFDHGKASFARGRQHINHCPVRSRECRDLGILESSAKFSVEMSEIEYRQRLQPALWMHSPQRMIPWPLRMANLSNASNQRPEIFLIRIGEDSFGPPHAENNLGRTTKRCRIVGEPRLSELQTMPAKGNFR